MTTAANRGHVFLSHSDTDTQAARQLAEVLRRNGINVWFDKDDISPGANWMSTLEEAISSASAMIVYIGSSGVQSWVDREVRFGLVRNTDRRQDFLFIPILGEGAELSDLPPFIQQHHYVDLRDRHNIPGQIKRLIERLRKVSPDHSAILPDYWKTHSPFRGLQAFRAEDAWLFFGRDADTTQLISQLGRAPTLAIVGNSGSGKTSLIQAGLITALRRGNFLADSGSVTSWRIAVFRPSSSPFEYLAESLPGQLAPELSVADRARFISYCRETLPLGGPALRNAIAALTVSNEHVLLFADQFEELFTLVEDTGTRNLYIESLLNAGQRNGVHLVFAIRADFYANCLDHPNLSTALSTNLYNVPLMGSAQLRVAIENRLSLAGASAEPGLIESLLEDVGKEPGNLALLEHALSQLWQKSSRSNRVLTNQAYADIGRLRGALGKHADEVYAGLRQSDQQLARRILLELVQLGDGSQDTRRRVAKERLFCLDAHQRVEHIIAYLTSNRLITTSGEGPESPSENFVEVTHEALIREWQTLREWLKDAREDLRLERNLMQAAHEWRELKRDTGALIRGVRLAQGQDWFARYPQVPSLIEEFLAESHEAEEAAARREREETVRAQRSAARSRWFSYALGTLFLIAVVAAWLAHQQQLTAESKTLAARAEQSMSQNRPAALDMALAGWGKAKTAEANLAVAHVFPQVIAKLEGHSESIIDIAYSPDGKRVVTASADHTAEVWNASDGQPLFRLEGHGDIVSQATFSPNSQRIVTASADHTARVWSAADGQLLMKLEGHTRNVLQASFSRDGQRILTAGDDSTVRVWNADTGKMLVKIQILTAPIDQTTRSVNDLTNWEFKLGHPRLMAAFSPDGERILTAGLDDQVQVWNATSGKRLLGLENYSGRVLQAVFSPDGQRIATAQQDNTARIWDASNGRLLTKLEGHSDNVLHVAFSPDGQHIVTASADHTARVWSTRDGRMVAKLAGHTDIVSEATFSPGGQQILTVSEDDTARVWNLSNSFLLGVLQGNGIKVSRAAFSPEGERIVTSNATSTAWVWGLANCELLNGADLSDISQPRDIAHHFAVFSADRRRIAVGDSLLGFSSEVLNATNFQVLAVLKGEEIRNPVFSPDNQRIVTFGFSHIAQVWNVSDGRLVAKLEGDMNGITHKGNILDASFSPDSQRILTTSEDHTARIWNATNGKLLLTLEGHTGEIIKGSFSPNGRYIVTASADHTARVWDATKGQLLLTLEAHTSSVLSAVFSPDSLRIVTTSQDHTARMWNVSNGELIFAVKGSTSDRVWSATFSPDGERVVMAGANDSVNIWNAADGKLVGTLGTATDVSEATFSQDGKRILTDGTEVWDATNFQLLGRLGYSTAAAFAPDGLHVITVFPSHVYRILTLSDLAELLAQ